VPALGVGTNRWGGRSVDQVGLEAAYSAALDAGTGFFDTAEVYTGGRSEKSLGLAVRRDGRPAVVASKFAPYPHRLSAAQFRRALDRTLERMGADSIDLYYLHFPFSPRGVGSWIKAMAEAVASKKIRAVGVSNCSAAQMRTAASVLARYDVPLAANQVQYSLLHRKPEHDGVLEACRQMDVALVAYRPIGGGAIRSSSPNGRAGGATGDPAGAPRRDAALVRVLDEVGSARHATVTQVALAWLLQRDERVVAIPGATKATHVDENAGALSLELTEEELAAIDRATA
jgi:aryl-alcohol dehydrogenase-like predicted oxidoreductase